MVNLKIANVLACGPLKSGAKVPNLLGYMQPPSWEQNKLAAMSFSEMLVPCCLTIRCYIPENGNLHNSGPFCRVLGSGLGECLFEISALTFWLLKCRRLTWVIGTWTFGSIENCEWINMQLTLRRLMSYIYMEHPFLMFLDHTQRRITVGRTPLDKWSARRRDLYLTTLTTDKHPCPR